MSATHLRLHCSCLWTCRQRKMLVCAGDIIHIHNTSYPKNPPNRPYISNNNEKEEEEEEEEERNAFRTVFNTRRCLLWGKSFTPKSSLQQPKTLHPKPGLMYTNHFIICQHMYTCKSQRAPNLREL